MFELKVVDHDGKLVVDSRDVAEMVGKNHKELLRDIRKYISIINRNYCSESQERNGKSKNRTPSQSPQTLVSQQSAILRSATNGHQPIAPQQNPKLDSALETPQTLNAGIGAWDKEIGVPKIGGSSETSQTLTPQQNSFLRTAHFFIEGSYKSDDGSRTYPCYLLTKQGCEMVANKLTGEKGVLFTAAYVQKFNAMEKHIKGEKLTSDEKLTIQRMRAEAMLNNSKVRKADLWVKFANMVNIPEHKQICAAYGTQELTGGAMVLPLPEIEKTYSAEDVGKMYGISANAVGRLANQHGLKTEAYGHLVLDKSRYSNKEVEVWRYNQAGADAIGALVQ